MAKEGIELGNAYIQILPSARGLSANINGLMEDEGSTAGNTLGNSIAAAASSTLQDSLSSLGESFSAIGSTLSTYVTVPIMAAATASVAAFSSVDEALDDVAIRTGATGEALEDMQGIATGIARSMPVQWGQIGAAVGEVNTRFGSTGDELNDLSRYFLQFASVNNQDVASSVDNVSRMIAGFGLEASDATNILDMLNVVGQQTGEDVGQLSATLAANAGTFAAMGLSAEEAASFMVQASLSGMTTTQAMTGLRSAVNYAAREGISLSDVFGQVAENADDTALAAEVFGGRAGQAMANAVANGSISLTDFSSVLGDFAGSVETTFNETLDPIDQMTTTLNSLKELGYELVDAFGPVISDAVNTVIPVIQDLTEKWKALDPQTQQLIIKLALVAAAVGPVLLAGSKLISAIQTIGGGLTSLGSTFANFGSHAANAASAATGATASFSSMAGTALMLVALGAAVWLVAQGMSVMADAAIRLANAGPAAIATFFGMVAAATAMSAVILLVGASASVSAVGLLALGAAVLMIAGGIALITEACAHLVSEITSLVQTIINGSNQINSIIRQLAASVRSIIREVATAIVAIIRTIAVSINSVVSNVAGNIQSTVRTVAAAIQSIARSIQTTVQSIARSIQTTIQTAANSVGRIVDSIGGSISRVLNSVAGVVASVGNAAMQTGRGFDTFTAALSRLVGMNLLDIAATMTAVSRGLDSIVSSARGIPAVTQSIRELSAAFASAQLRFNPGNLTLPHFSMSGSFNAQRGTVPQVRVQWYARAAEQGALFTVPQLIGVGDSAQGELLYGHDSLMRDISSAVSEGMSSEKTPIVINVYGHEGQNVDELADAVVWKLQHKVDQKGAVYA